MFARMIDDFKESTGTALRLTELGAVAALALFITLCFLCAAAFIYVLQNFGLIEACLTGAAIFFVVALVVAACYAVRKNQVKTHARENEKSALQTALADPMLVATGIQLIRAIGVKKLIPILAVGGLALGLLASRHAPPSGEAPAE
ncbi:MAG: hypothetical protein E7813_10505 [Bradyrhizobium sp.]|uniref:hypothetical protein n=1 Tax=Bradyrhizobium sp. TaxID=376 RepID=UPI001214E344|nr:hypothetical protein [Bradyrhizobium sp.]THD68451.1 MAG: hypothetical protein E7813_10505 [Bradyrhizobium sp.]